MKTMYVMIAGLFLLGMSFFSVSAQSLAEKLGYKATDRLLIINNDDAGMCHASNMATIEGMEQGIISSATIMVPCPWYSEIAEYARNHPEKGFGIHLTLTSEWKYYRWKPLLSKEQVPGLYAPDGYMWRSVAEVYKASSPAEALLEGRAQIQRALDDGINVTHIDSHMGTYQLDIAYQKIYMQLAQEFHLSLLVPAQEVFEAAGFPGLRAEFTERGFVFPDYWVRPADLASFDNYRGQVKELWMETLSQLPAGITEINLHATVDSDESRTILPFPDGRIRDYEVFTHDKDMRKLMEDKGIIIINFQLLRDLQRKNANGKMPNHGL